MSRKDLQKIRETAPKQMTNLLQIVLCNGNIEMLKYLLRNYPKYKSTAEYKQAKQMTEEEAESMGELLEVWLDHPQTPQRGISNILDTMKTLFEWGEEYICSGISKNGDPILYTVFKKCVKLFPEIKRNMIMVTPQNTKDYRQLIAMILASKYYPQTTPMDNWQEEHLLSSIEYKTLTTMSLDMLLHDDIKNTGFAARISVYLRNVIPEMRNILITQACTTNQKHQKSLTAHRSFENIMKTYCIANGSIPWEILVFILNPQPTTTVTTSMFRETIQLLMSKLFEAGIRIDAPTSTPIMEAFRSNPLEKPPTANDFIKGKFGALFENEPPLLWAHMDQMPRNAAFSSSNNCSHLATFIRDTDPESDPDADTDTTQDNAAKSRFRSGKQREMRECPSHQIENRRRNAKDAREEQRRIEWYHLPVYEDSDDDSNAAADTNSTMSISTEIISSDASCGIYTHPPTAIKNKVKYNNNLFVLSAENIKQQCVFRYENRRPISFPTTREPLQMPIISDAAQPHPQPHPEPHPQPETQENEDDSSDEEYEDAQQEPEPLQDATQPAVRKCHRIKNENYYMKKHEKDATYEWMYNTPYMIKQFPDLSIAAWVVINSDIVFCHTFLKAHVEELQPNRVESFPPNVFGHRDMRLIHLVTVKYCTTRRQKKFVELLDVLLESGANLMHTTDQGWMPIHIAACYCPENVETFFDAELEKKRPDQIPFNYHNVPLLLPTPFPTTRMFQSFTPRDIAKMIKWVNHNTTYIDTHCKQSGGILEKIKHGYGTYNEKWIGWNVYIPDNPYWKDYRASLLRYHIAEGQFKDQPPPILRNHRETWIPRGFDPANIKWV
jgi:hypothetical protein